MSVRGDRPSVYSLDVTIRHLGYKYRKSVVRGVNKSMTEKKGAVFEIFKNRLKGRVTLEKKALIKKELYDLLKSESGFKKLKVEDFSYLIDQIYSNEVSVYKVAKTSDERKVRQKVTVFLVSRLTGDMTQDQRRTVREEVQAYMREEMSSFQALSKEAVYDRADGVFLRRVKRHQSAQEKKRVKRAVKNLLLDRFEKGVTERDKEVLFNRLVNELEFLSDVEAIRIFFHANLDYSAEISRFLRSVETWLQPRLAGEVEELPGKLEVFIHDQREHFPLLEEGELHEIGKRALPQIIDSFRKKREQQVIRHQVATFLKDHLKGPIDTVKQQVLFIELLDSMKIPVDKVNPLIQQEFDRHISVHRRKLEVETIRKHVREFLVPRLKGYVGPDTARRLQQELFDQMKSTIEGCVALPEMQVRRLAAEYLIHQVEGFNAERIRDYVKRPEGEMTSKVRRNLEVHEKELIKRMVNDFLHPYITGEITQENEPKERASLAAILLGEEGRFVVLTRKEVLDYAFRAYCDRAVLGFQAKLGLYSHPIMTEFTDKSPEFQVLVTALVEALNKDFPSAVGWSKEVVQGEVKAALGRVNRRNQMEKELLKEKEAPLRARAVRARERKILLVQRTLQQGKLFFE